MKTPHGANRLESKRMAPSALGRFTKLSGLGALALLSACNLDDPGISPPRGQITYPMGLGLVRDANDPNGKPTHLVVLNSNFDLRYNAGSIQSYNLDVLSELIDRDAPDSCRELSIRTGSGDAVGRTDAGLFEDNTTYPDAAVAADGGEMDAAADAGGTLDGSIAEAGITLDAGPLIDAAVSVDGGALDAGQGDAGEDAAVAFPQPQTMSAGDIPLPANTSFGSQRGILCDGRDDQISRNQGEYCCLDRDEVLTVSGAAGKLFADELLIESYGTGLVVTPENRIYASIRSKNRLIFADAVNGDLQCGSQGKTDDCNQGAGQDSKDNAPDATFPSTPIALVSGKLGDLGLTDAELATLTPAFNTGQTFVATSHECVNTCDRGQLSLFVDDGKGPVLQDVLKNGVARSTGVFLAAARNAPSDDPGTKLFYVTSSLTSPVPGIQRVGVRVLEDVNTQGQRSPHLKLYETTPIGIASVSSTFDLRGVDVHPDDPNRLSVLIRGAQQSVAFLERDPSMLNEAKTLGSSQMGTGPSKLATGVLTGPDGRTRRFLFASAFNDGAIYVFDLDNKERLDNLVLGFSGAFDMVIDEHRNLMYVSDFGASVVRVVDLTGLTDRNAAPPRIVITLGKLTFPERLR